MPRATVNDIELHYERVGEGSPLLLIHGLGSSSLDWEYQVDHFSQSHDLIIPDLRGHGRSTKPDGPYSIQLFAADIAALINDLGVGPVDVVGISLGGMVGFQLIADRAELVSRLVAVNALPAFEMTRISERIQVAVRKVITRRLSMVKIGTVLSKRLFPGPDLSEQRTKMVERWAQNDKTAYEASFRAILDWKGVANAMTTTPIPITVVSSDLDYLSPEDKQRYVDAMPTAKMVVIPDAHHGVPMEHPERFNEVLADLLV